MEAVKRSHKKKVAVPVVELQATENEDEFVWNPNVGSGSNDPNGYEHSESVDEDIFNPDADEDDFEIERVVIDSGWEPDVTEDIEDSIGEESQEYVRKPTKKQLQASDILSRAMKITAKAPKAPKTPKTEKEKEVHFAPIDYELPKEFKFDTYEEGLAKLTDLARNNSIANWTTGWMLLGIPTKYGRETIGELASNIGVPKATLNMYRWTAQAFSPEDVATFPVLTFSHFKIVTKLALIDKEGAMDALEKAAIGDMGKVWSVDKLTAYMKQEPQEKLKPLSVPGGQLMIARDADELSMVALPEGWTAFILLTDSGGDGWYKAADEAGVLNNLVKATFKAIHDDN